jgi:hypothetical protein
MRKAFLFSGTVLNNYLSVNKNSVYKGISILFAGAILLSGISSCERDPGPVPDLGFNYFPDEVGRYVVYTVDSFFYNGITYPAIIVNTKFQIKEKIESIYTDNEGDPAMRLERYIKLYDPLVPYSDMNWTLKDVWSQKKTLRNVEKVEENVRFVKLVFPVQEGQEWNGNAKNTLGEENYFYQFFDVQRTIGNIRFDSVLQVTQHNESSIVHQIYSEEKYARNVGMIYKRMINVNSQPPAAWNTSPPMPYLSDSLEAFYNKPILDRATAGFHYTMTVNSFGTE